MTTWETELPPEDRSVGDSGHAEDHGKIVAAIAELRDAIDTVDGSAPDVKKATAAELEAGTLTAQRVFTPKLIHDEIARQIAAASSA